MIITSSLLAADFDNKFSAGLVKTGLSCTRFGEWNMTFQNTLDCNNWWCKGMEHLKLQHLECFGTERIAQIQIPRKKSISTQKTSKIAPVSNHWMCLSRQSYFFLWSQVKQSYMFRNTLIGAVLMVSPLIVSTLVHSRPRFINDMF